MRFPNQRLAQLFAALQSETLPQDELARRFSVSTRTVRTDITALNALLEQHGAQFVLARGAGYQLKIDDVARAATQFFCLLKGELHALMMCGLHGQPTRTQVDEHINTSVDFFLRAYEPR